jgi:hypothetical protein
MTDRHTRRLVAAGLPVIRRRGTLHVLPSKAHAWLKRHRAGHARLREALHREHAVRAADLERRIAETLKSYLPIAAIDATWAAHRKVVEARFRAWPAVLAPRLAPIIATTKAGFQAALAAADEVRALLEQAANDGPADPTPAGHRAVAHLQAFATPLPADASPRERVVTLRSRMAQLRHLIRRGELELIESVTARWADALLWVRQIALARVPTLAAELAGRRAGAARIRADLERAVHDVLWQLQRGDRVPRRTRRTMED